MSPQSVFQYFFSVKIRTMNLILFLCAITVFATLYIPSDELQTRRPQCLPLPFLDCFFSLSQNVFLEPEHQHSCQGFPGSFFGRGGGRTLALALASVHTPIRTPSKWTSSEWGKQPPPSTSEMTFMHSRATTLFRMKNFHYGECGGCVIKIGV